MKGVKIIAIQDVLPVIGISYAPGVLPKTLDIAGQKFLQASEVIINSFSSPEFLVLSDSRIWAQLPRGQENQPIQTVVILAEQPSPDRSSLLHFRLGKTFKSIKGIERMVQVFVKLLLQTPGTDKFHPQLGGGLLSLVGQNISDAKTALSASIVSAVSRTRDQLIALQNQTLRTPPDERLLSADVLGVGGDAVNTAIGVRVALSAQSGRAAVANLTF